MGAMATTTATDTHGGALPHGWTHWPGQLVLHPDTQVLPDLDPLPYIVAWRWALMATTVRGEAWWYGYAPIQRNGVIEVGWWLVPRDPVADPGPLDGEVPGGR
jgi:hypothetical protein